MKSESQNKVSNDAQMTLSADDVVRYLKDHPDFFVSHEDLLADLKIPHESGKAISLLERQVILLRERNQELNRQIQEFIATANENDNLFEKTRIVLLELLKVSSLLELAHALEKEITSNFSASESKLLFITDFPDQYPGLDCRPVSETKTILGKLFDKQRTYCGAMKPEQTAFLFPASTDTIASTAMVPIHINTGDKRSAGFKAIPVLVLASSSSNHFNNNQDTLFLDFIGEVLSALIVHLR